MTTSSAPRVQRFADKQRAKGLKEVRSLWLHPDDFKAIRAEAKKLREAREALNRKDG